MANLFKKAAILTDIHFGLKSNSTTHNEDCLNFVKWFITKAKEEGCETCLMLGDWHNNRAAINIVTLNYSLQALELLGKAFDRVFFIPGNHDLYYRDKRDIQSAEWARHIPNIEIVNDFYKEGGVSFVPWLVGDDHKKVQKIDAEYMFGHFELPSFYMNAMVQMPDVGEISRDHFKGVGHMFSGHFHKRQTNKNITYVGNCFPHNYADAGDDDRGMAVLAWGEKPVHHAWPDQPRYRVYDLSAVLKKPEDLLQPGMHCRVKLDIDISYEEATFIKETFVNQYKCREISLIPQKQMEEITTDVDIQHFESVDQIVAGEIAALDTENFNKKMLLDIYNEL